MLSDPSIARIVLQGDESVAQSHIGEARSMLRGLLNRLRLGNVNVGRDQYLCADGSLLVAEVADSNNLIVISVPGRSITTQVNTLIADFLSGVVVNNGDGIYPTVEAASLRPGTLAGGSYYPTADRYGYTDNQGNKYYASFSPGYYSGAMAKCVQAVMGFGNAVGQSIYDQTETQSFKLPEDQSQREEFVKKNSIGEFDIYKQLEISDRNLRAPRYAADDLRIDGLYLPDVGRPWIVRIDKNNGVLAMRLPINDLTTTQEFSDRIKALNVDADTTIEDVDGEAMLQMFGGFPTGRGIPTDDQTMLAYKRAGIVIQLATADDITLSEPDNDRWEFSSDGSQSWSVGTETVSGNHKIVSVYRMDIAIQVADEYIMELKGIQEQLSIYFNLRIQPDNPEYYYYVQYKSSLLSGEDAQYLYDLAQTDIQQSFDIFDGIELSSDDQGSASVSVIEGRKDLYTNRSLKDTPDCDAPLSVQVKENDSIRVTRYQVKAFYDNDTREEEEKGANFGPYDSESLDMRVDQTYQSFVSASVSFAPAKRLLSVGRVILGLDYIDENGNTIHVISAAFCGNENENYIRSKFSNKVVSYSYRDAGGAERPDASANLLGGTKSLIYNTRIVGLNGTIFDEGQRVIEGPISYPEMSADSTVYVGIV